MNTLSLTNDLGTLNLSGNLICKPTTDPIPSGDPKISEPVRVVFDHVDGQETFRGIITVITSGDLRSLVYVQNLDNGDLNFYLGDGWSDSELARAEIFGVLVS